MSDLSEIDWLGLPKQERVAAIRALYKAVSAVAAATDQTVDTLVCAALPEEMGTDYRSNFRRGNIAAAKAMLIYRYLEEHHFDLAKTFEPTLFQTNPKSAWEQFLDAHTIVGGLRIIPMEREFGLVQRAKDVMAKLQTLRLGQEFCLELASLADGVAIAFQGYQGRWHSFPLGESPRHFRVSIHEGKQLLPHSAGGDPIPLCEEHWSGPNSFVIVTTSDSRLPIEPKQLIQLTDQSLRV